MELDYKAIGKRIKIARIKADMTQERLAEMIELSPTHLSNIETGTTRVSLPTIIAIANGLTVSVDDLLCDNVIKSKVQFEKDISSLLDDCDDTRFGLSRICWSPSRPHCGVMNGCETNKTEREDRRRESPRRSFLCPIIVLLNGLSCWLSSRPSERKLSTFVLITSMFFCSFFNRLRSS